MGKILFSKTNDCRLLSINFSKIIAIFGVNVIGLWEEIKFLGFPGFKTGVTQSILSLSGI